MVLIFYDKFYSLLSSRVLRSILLEACKRKAMDSSYIGLCVEESMKIYSFMNVFSSSGRIYSCDHLFNNFL